MKERFISTVEFIDRYGRANKEVKVYTNYGKKPTIGDFINAFKDQGLEVELKDITNTNMIFRPIDPVTTPVISLRIIRTLKDFTYSYSATK
jgi:hypothetical protein